MVSSVGSYSSASVAFNRPDPSQIASKLFSKLDTKGQGYIEESDLQSAFSQVFSSTGSTTTASDASSLFSALDSDSNGQVTESEFSSSVQKLAEALDQQAFGSRITNGMGGTGGTGGAGAMGSMPPPPPRNEDDAGFTQDQLRSQLDEIGSTDSQRSSLISSVVANFEAADANGDGKVSRAEAMAYQQSSSSATSSSSSGTSTAASATADTSNSTTAGSATSTAHTEARMMHRLMALMRAYGSDADSSASMGSSVAISA